MSGWRGQRHQPGTRVQYRNGYIRIKTKEGMLPENRWMWEQYEEELKPGDRVFHIDGDRTNNNIKNLQVQHRAQIKFTMLKESRVLWKPTGKAKVYSNA